MSSKWHQKKEKKREEQALRDEETARNSIDFEGNLGKDVRGAAMGEGEEELFEKKLSKDEKKALAKAKRDAKKKAKNKKNGIVDDDGNGNGGGGESGLDLAKQALKNAQDGLFTEKAGSNTSNEAADKLASEGTICTFASSKKGVDERSRDINVTNFTLQHKGMVMLDGTDIVLNHGNRYGLLGRNGCGKSTLMKALGARAVPIPSGIDAFHLKEEIEPSDTVTALDAVMSVDKERGRLELEADNLNNALSALADDYEKNSSGDGGGDNDEELTMEEQQEKIMDLLNYVYERLDSLDAATAETRASSILKGLGFAHEMQKKVTKDFSGGWRMRV